MWRCSDVGDVGLRDDVGGRKKKLDIGQSTVFYTQSCQLRPLSLASGSWQLAGLARKSLSVQAQISVDCL